QKCHLRVRTAAERRRADSVQGALLPLRDFLPDLRRRSVVPASVRGRVHRSLRRRTRYVARVHPAARRRPRLGLAPRLSRMEMSDAAPQSSPLSDVERDELRRHGILLTSLEELYNWGRSNSIWP